MKSNTTQKQNQEKEYTAQQVLQSFKIIDDILAEYKFEKEPEDLEPIANLDVNYN